MSASGDDATTTFRGVVTVSHHTFYLVDDGRFPSPLPETTTGLVDAAADAAVIRTGIHTGAIDVTCQALPGPPPLDLAGWDAAAEISFRAWVGRVTVASLGFDLPEQFPLLTPAGPGEYRVRVYARGRDADIDGTASTPFEHYLIQVWPTPLGPPGRASAHRPVRHRTPHRGRPAGHPTSAGRAIPRRSASRTPAGEPPPSPEPRPHPAPRPVMTALRCSAKARQGTDRTASTVPGCLTGA